MRLLIFHNILFAQYKSIYFEKIYNELKKNNHDFLVIQSSFSEKSRINHFNKDQLLKKIRYPFKLISQKPIDEINQIQILYHWIKAIIKFKPTVINFTGYNSFSIIFLLIICKFLRIKTIVTNESVLKGNQKQRTLKFKFNQFIKKFTLKIPDYFYTFGINANNLLFEFNVDKKKIINFGNTFDKNSFSSSFSIENNNQKTKLLFVGRLIEEKNLELTIKTLAKVNDLIPIQFDIYGDGPIEASLLKLINDNQYSFVQLKSKIIWEDLDKIYPQYSNLILFSKSEPWGMVANEAQHFNLNIICTSNCGCANDLVINNYNGLIIDSLDSNQTPNSIANYLLNQKDSSIFTSKNNKIFDESYAIERFIKKLYSLNEYN